MIRNRGSVARAAEKSSSRASLAPEGALIKAAFPHRCPDTNRDLSGVMQKRQEPRRFAGLLIFDLAGMRDRRSGRKPKLLPRHDDHRTRHGIAGQFLLQRCHP